MEVSKKSYVTAVILSGIFGPIGIHHFYLERWAMGFFDLGLLLLAIYLMYWHNQPLLAGILFFIDVVHTIIVTYLLLIGKYKDGHGKPILYPGQIN